MTCIGEGHLHVGCNVRGLVPVYIHNVTHAHTDVFHIVWSTLSFSTADLEIVGLEKEHQVTGWWCTEDRSTISVLEQNREHSCVVKVGVGQNNCIDLLERKCLRSCEVRHWVGVGRNVDTNVDHDSRFIGCYKVTCTTNLLVGTKSCDTCPCRTWSLWTVNVQSKVPQQFAALFSIGFSISTNVSNGLGEDRRCSLNRNFPAR